MHESFNSLVKLILPESIEEYFEVINTKKEGDEIHIYLKELNNIPSEYSDNKLVSKGFFDEITVQDFPIRGFKVLLHVTRRRWLNENTGKVVFRDWDLVANGTRITKDLRLF
jgi:hypothetical protein